MLKVKFLRVTRNLSQWDLAKVAGSTQGRYSLLETGVQMPTVAEGSRLSEFFKIPIATLFNEFTERGDVESLVKSKVSAAVKEARRQPLRPGGSLSGPAANSTSIGLWRKRSRNIA